MGVTVSHVKSITIPDSTDTNIVRPVDWNSGHLVTVDGFAGTGFSGTNISGTIDSAGVSLSVAVPGGGGLTNINVSAGTTSNLLSALTFNNANGITFGLNASTITASHNGLTTAMASNRGSDFVQATAAFAGTNASGTIASNGISVSVGNYLTTARASNDGLGANTAQSNVTWTANSAGLSLDARGYAGTNSTFNGTNVSGSITQNSNGLRLDLSVGAGGAADGYNSAQFTNSTANSTMPLVWAGNSNGSGNLTMGLTGSTVTASFSTPTTPAQFSGGNSNLGNTQGDTGTVTGRIVFVGTNNITLSGSTNGGSMTISISGGAGAAGNTGYVSAGTTNASLGTLSVADGNGVSFGVNGQTLTATVKTDYLTTAMASNRGSDFVQATAAFAGTNASGTIASNGISVSVGNYLTTARASNDAIGLNTAITQNGVSMTANSGGLSLNFPAFLTTAAQSDHSHGNPTLALTNLSGTTASASNGFTLSLSAGAGGAGDGGNVLAAGAQTANTTGTVNFANSNGITFGMSNSSQITASHNGVTQQSTQPVAASGSNGSFTFNTATFGNSNGVSFYTTNGSMVASHNALTSQSNQALSGANGSFTFQTATFANSNGVSWSTGTQGMYATVKTDYLTTAAQSDHSHGNPTLALTNLSGTTASNSAGLTLSLSAAAPGAGGGVAIVGSNATYTSGTVSIMAAGGAITVASNTGQRIDLSVPATSSLVAGANITVSTNGSTISIIGASVAPSPVYVVAGTTNGSLGTIEFSNLNGVSFGLNGSTITASHNGLTTAALSDHSHGNPTLALTNLTGTTASASNGFTLSLSAAAAGGGVTVNSTIPHGMFPASSVSQTMGAMGVTSGSAIFWPFLIEDAFQGDHIMLAMNMSYVTSTVSGQQTCSFSYGLYSNNADTLSQISSNSFSWAFTNSSVSGTCSFPTSSGTGGFGYGTISCSATNQGHSLFGTAGLKLLELPFTNTISLSAGQYWMGVQKRFSSSSANIGISFGMQGNMVSQVNNRAPMGQQSSAMTTNPLYKQPLQGMGPYTSTESAGYGGTALPVSAMITGIAHTMSVYPCITLDKSQ